jgi:hypothetical protein
MAALATSFLALMLGGWLSTIYLLREEAPRGRITGLVHGSLGAATVVLLFLALQGPRRGTTTGAGGFGWTSFVILALALTGGLAILATHMRRRPVSPVLVAMHACAGLAGAVILAAWWVAPSSYGR